ncbi:30S ribosomal protein S6 [Patescibacteria group bacterium]|nr:30S ribosomal protein S6 [Patescibacteria group bacterium]MCL5010085.1 30S ribosomal protein S6 [Patescibacteria group bacterium]
MRTYELALILRGSLIKPKRDKLLDKIRSLISDAKITKVDEWGEKALAYPIKKENLGFYFLFELEQADDKPLPLSDLEKKLLAEEDVLRHLLVRKNKKPVTSD